ncbi:hypothetical protein JX580_00445 [Thiomicrospira microaerophila]|uniref:hypothetical protein n=1 Tax=Thiomicrospira microaerophila TaxID=406020 RepID=UPI00200DAE63|nr:hypothetical protein [Thiomicrospira microaerophila]UQB42419.1 hypothetical protein JX580_00445 [Thiomicrospira microaerophila]
MGVLLVAFSCGGYDNARFAREMAQPEVAACYQALVAGPMVGLDGQLYIGQYNQGAYFR